MDDTLSFLDEENKPQTVSIHSLAADKKVIIFGVPSAFPLTCRRWQRRAGTVQPGIESAGSGWFNHGLITYEVSIMLAVTNLRREPIGHIRYHRRERHHLIRCTLILIRAVPPSAVSSSQSHPLRRFHPAKKVDLVSPHPKKDAAGDKSSEKKPQSTRRRKIEREYGGFEEQIAL